MSHFTVFAGPTFTAKWSVVTVKVVGGGRQAHGSDQRGERKTSGGEQAQWTRQAHGCSLANMKGASVHPVETSTTQNGSGHAASAGGQPVVVGLR